MAKIAIIGGTGLSAIEGLSVLRRQVVGTPYGEPSGHLTIGALGESEIVFLPRHGHAHRIPPHQVNYRANLWALREVGVEQVIAVAAVGGISTEMQPRRIVIPDQIIDYTHGRAATFFEGALEQVVHVDFSYPYCEPLRQRLLSAASGSGLAPVARATYAATQGPRLESAAEIDRLERDGADIVGMTGMPEAVLARELELCYAHCALVVNWAAGRTDNGEVITMEEIEANLHHGMGDVRRALTQLLVGGS